LARTNHIQCIPIRYLWQGSHQTYGHIWRTYTVLANPTNFLLPGRGKQRRLSRQSERCYGGCHTLQTYRAMLRVYPKRRRSTTGLQKWGRCSKCPTKVEKVRGGLAKVEKAGATLLSNEVWFASYSNKYTATCLSFSSMFRQHDGSNRVIDECTQFSLHFAPFSYFALA